MRPTFSFRPHPLALAVGFSTLIAAGGLALSPLAVAQQTTNAGQTASEETQTFDIPAGPLSRVLSQFAGAAGVAISFDASKFNNIQSEGLQGQYTVEEGFAVLLQGTDVVAQRQANGDYVLTRSDTRTMAPITVTGARESAFGPVEGYKAERSATATRTATPIMDVPGSIQVVSREVIDDQNAQDLHEAVRNVSGVFVDNSFGGIGHDFNVRGFNQDFKLRNGFREEGTAIFRSPDLANVERVEVLKGPASITSGRLAPGGVINIVTERPTAEPMRRVELEAGTTVEGGSSVQPSIDVSGPITADGSVKYRLNALYSHRDSYREPFREDFERVFVAPVFSFELGADTDLLVELEYMDDKRPFDRGIIHFDGQFSDRDRNLQSDTVVSEVESAIGSYTLDHRFTDNLSLRHRSQYIWLDRFNLENVPFMAASSDPGNFPNAQPGDFARYIGSNDRVNRTFSTQTELHGLVEGAGAEHKLLLALDFSRNEQDGVFQSSDSTFAYPDFQGVKNKINIFNPVDNVPAPTRADLTFISNDTTSVTEEFGLLLQDQITLSDQWEVLLGGRFAWVDQENENNLAGTETTQEDDAVFSPRAGVVYKPLETVSLYASYSESFEPNSARDQNDNFLDPTKGEQFEVGVKSEFLQSRLRTTLAAFEITKTNIPRRVSSPGGSYSVPTGEQRSRGIELDATGQISDSWSVIGSYAFLDTEITKDDNNQGNELAGVPSHSASLWSNYQVQAGSLRGLELGAGVFYRGERQANNANSYELPSYTRVDARVGYGRDNWRADLTLKNLLDTEDNYEAVDFGPLVKPGIPATVIGSVSVAF